MDIKKFMPSLSSNMAQSVDYFIIKTPSSSHKTDLQHHKFDAPHLFDALGGRPLRPALNAALRNSCPDLHENDTCQQFIFLDVKEAINGDAPENNPRHTTVYVGNLATKVTQLELHHHFHYFGAG